MEVAVVGAPEMILVEEASQSPAGLFDAVSTTPQMVADPAEAAANAIAQHDEDEPNTAHGESKRSA